MSDIKVLLKLDYSNDTAFSSVAPFAAVTEINPAEQRLFFKECGWFSGWSKELTGIDLSQNGGNALLGEWAFARKTVRFCQHPLVPTAQVVDEIEMHVDSLNIGKSPMIVGFSIDTVRVAIAIVKTDPFSAPSVMGNKIQNASIPYLANGAWATHPSYQKGRPVCAFSPAKNTVGIDVNCETVAGFEISFMAFETAGDAAVFSLNNPNPLLEGIAACKNPYSVVAQAYENGYKKAMIRFDAPMGAPMAKYPRKSQAKSQTQTAPSPRFTAPDGLTMPNLPSGCKWAMNVRGIVLMEKGGELFFPHEIYDLIQMEHDAQLAVDKGDNFPMEDVANVRSLFEYMESVGNGIALNYRVLREFQP